MRILVITLLFILNACGSSSSSSPDAGTPGGGTPGGGTPGGDPCLSSPTPGTVCTSGTVFLGSLNGHDLMTTPGGCGEIPSGQIAGGSGTNAYSTTDFTPTCSGGTDSLTKKWNNGSGSYYDIPGLTNYSTQPGQGYGSTNIDANLGDANTANIVAITSSGQGGYHAAARYCDKLDFGGYTDWYLPNRAELNIFWDNVASIPGLDKTGTYYWSSTEYNQNYAWYQQFNFGGTQDSTLKSDSRLFRCVRRF